jgi:hypothetical protein
MAISATSCSTSEFRRIRGFRVRPAPGRVARADFRKGVAKLFWSTGLRRAWATSERSQADNRCHHCTSKPSTIAEIHVPGTWVLKPQLTILKSLDPGVNATLATPIRCAIGRATRRAIPGSVSCPAMRAREGAMGKYQLSGLQAAASLRRLVCDEFCGRRSGRNSL